MNDFSEIEHELKKLRPAHPLHGFLARVEQAMADQEISEDKFICPNRFRLNWIALGVGVGAAALFLVLAQVSTHLGEKQSERIAQSPAAPETRSTSANQFIPTGATQVVYNTRDEGLHFTDRFEGPMRRLRYQTQETLQWRNARTGESLLVSYPSEEIVLIPVSGQ
jgi:hypothetical protein